MLILPNLPDNTNLYPKLAGKTVNWLSSDTEERYRYNLKNSREMLSRNGWLDSQFNYSFNSFSFRCADFKESNNIVSLGCSFTQGVGLPTENTWTEIVAKRMNLENYNLGLAAGSNDLAFRLAYNWIPKLKPKLVILLSPHSNRTELIALGKYYSVFNDMAKDDKLVDHVSKSSYYKLWLTDENNLNCQLSRNILAIDNICKTNKTKLLVFHVNELVYEDYARDLMHPGIKSNIKFAQLVLDNL